MSLYLFILIVLVTLAVVGLIVGVSNDAVNFLNSAIGSKIAARWVILTVASIGILAGTLTSNGMMEIARSGLFHPAMFTFNDIMMIFLAVMICNVMLLDMFNTFGLPTSTTVSMIFELLGAAVFVALYKIWKAEPGTVSELSSYINSSSALKLISAILASVVVAFVFGSIIMFFSRLLFSFRYKRTFRRYGAIWCGLCLTAIAYFALFKGLKGSTMKDTDFMLFISNNIEIMLLSFFIGFSILLAFLQHSFKINILKIVVLAGTGALALSFAGNDLVNFIGVSMGGVTSYEIAGEAIISTGGNIEIGSLMMSELSNPDKPIEVTQFYLLIAGIIMVLSLWFSKKARTVTETEINLSRQGDGAERFGSTPASRALVRSARALNKQFSALLPDSVNKFIDSRFKITNYDKKNKASFDQIRAAMNLTVSALLISTATSFNLPLSTTYVTFMVAMGSSLSDRAWGRESAVYRITGVLTVITGWFVTALVAFTIAAIIGFLLVWGGIIAIVTLLVLCAIVLIQSSLLHKKREKKQLDEENLTGENMSVIEKCKEDVYLAFERMSRIYTQSLKGLAVEDRKKLKKLYKESKELHKKEKERKTFEMGATLVKLQQDEAVSTGHYYVQVVDYLYEVSESLLNITKASFEYIDNNHPGLSDEQIADLESLNKAVTAVYTSIMNMLRTSDFSEFESTLAKRDSMFDLFASNIKAQIKRMKGNESSMHCSILYLDIVSETKTMMLQSRNMMKAQRLFLGYEQVEKKKKEKKN